MQALLTMCGLRHWLPVLLQWLTHYDGLELMVDDEHDGPYASVIGLLRNLSRDGAQPSDVAFARRLATLPFLEYRVRRTLRAESFDGATAELWHPEAATSLSQWRLGFDVGAWHSSIPQIPSTVTAKNLLEQLSQSAGHVQRR